MKDFSMTALRETLALIFFGSADEEHLRYIIPLTGGWVVPTADPGQKVSTWIGYQIVSIRPTATSLMRDDVLFKECKIYVRLWSVGEQAEELMTSTLFWDERIDVKNLFDEYLGRLLQGGREIISQVYEQEGLNSQLCWMTDMLFAAYASLDQKSEEVNHIKWVERPHIRNLPEQKGGNASGLVLIDEYKKLMKG
jgi:hypothetical protein